MRIESIADHLDLVETIASWHWSEWGHCDPSGSLQSWTAGLRQRILRDCIPTTYVALEGDLPVGSVTLVDNDMATRPYLWPWLAGLYVIPEARTRGIGSVLVCHAVAKVAEMDIPRLYLYTSSARRFYEKLGWQPIAQDFYEDEPVTVMAIDTTAQDDWK
jgi:GNAT superfamily N-acetyltransferase